MCPANQLSLDKEAASPMKRNFPIHPFLFGFFFIAAPLVNLLGDLEPILAIRFLLVSIFVNLGGLGIYWLITRDLQHSAFLCTLFWICVGLTSLSMMANIPATLFPIKATWISFLVLWILLSVLFARGKIWRQINDRFHITSKLNLVGLIIFFYYAFIMIFATVQSGMWSEKQAQWVAEKNRAELPHNGDQPDIYYIILDGYARNDVLQEMYGMDNKLFINELSALGFTVAEDSHTNYMQTALSLASSLNLEYLDAQAQQWGLDSADRKPPAEMIQHSLARAFLEKQGYQMVYISSGFYHTEIPDADERPAADYANGFNPYEQYWIQQSPFQILIPSDAYGYPLWGYSAHRERIIYSFNNLVEISKETGPKFVLAHILAPHPPFVLREDGSSIEPDRPFILTDGNHFPGSKEEYYAGYIGQVQYVNRRLMEILPGIIRDSRKPVIIILQADHGPGSKLNWSSAKSSCLQERSSILNAYFLPEEFRNEVYPSITPVNTFRLIFREFFQGDFPPLEDKVFFSEWMTPYRFQDVTAQVEEPCLE